MSSLRRLGIALGLASIVTVGCKFNPKIEANGFSCQTPKDCPSGYACYKATPGQTGVCCNQADTALCSVPPSAGGTGGAGQGYDAAMSMEVGAGVGGLRGTGGASANGGSTGNGGASGTGRVGAGGTTIVTSSGASPGTGGGLGTAGSTMTSVGTGGAPAGGGTLGTGGITPTGGATVMGGTKGTGVVTGKGGVTGSGGAGGKGGATGTGGVRTDASGVPIAGLRDSQTTSGAYLNLGDMRLINNRSGSEGLVCAGTTSKVYAISATTVGWDFNRPACGGQHEKPDFMEVEFGMTPFGPTSPMLATPRFSSTTLLPILVKDLTSLSVSIGSFSSSYQKPGYYDTNVQFWLSKYDPRTTTTPGVSAQVIMLLSWDGSRFAASTGWPCDKSGSLTAGDAAFTLCHQVDSWTTEKYKLFSFNLENGPLDLFSGKIDLKAILDWLTTTYPSIGSGLFLTRIEIGTELDDDTQGSAKLGNLVFEVNGVTKSFEFAP